MARRLSIRESLDYGGEEATSSSYSISSSSTSGTLYTSSGFHIDFELEPAKAVKKEEEQIQDIASLVREFFGGGDVSVLERWLTELGIGWVLHLPLPQDAASEAGELDQTCYDAPSWVQALAQIVKIIGSTVSLFPVDYCEKEPKTGRAPDRVSVIQLLNISEEEAIPDQLQFAKFFQEAMFKILPFVDWIVSVVASNGMEPPYKNLTTLLGIHGALSKALPQIQLASSLLSSAQVLRIQHLVVSLLEAKQVKMGGAIWSIMEEIRTCILEPMKDGDNSSGTVTLEVSSDIHKATRSVISYIEVLRTNYSSFAPIVSVNYVSHNTALPPLESMIKEIASTLEENLAKESESFPDSSLRFLFLFNNSHCICSVVKDDPVWANGISSFLSFVRTHGENTAHIWSYMESYLQASWAPVVSCLFKNPAPLWLWKNKNYSPLAKFESEFLKTYTTQKLWKVPHPGMRKGLREAITMKIVPDYKKYIEDNNITTPRITPWELEEMLQELFEGW